jgi:hypothetical protein
MDEISTRLDRIERKINLVGHFVIYAVTIAGAAAASHVLEDFSLGKGVAGAGFGLTSIALWWGLHYEFKK